jgi:tripartite-type tricarboxylate transporter receptor subunit TctC
VFGGPPGLSQEIVDYWADVCEQVTSNENFRNEMNELGQPPAFRGPDEAKASIEAMQERMQAIVDANDLAE